MMNESSGSETQPRVCDRDQMPQAADLESMAVASRREEHTENKREVQQRIIGDLPGRSDGQSAAGVLRMPWIRRHQRWSNSPRIGRGQTHGTEDGHEGPYAETKNEVQGGPMEDRWDDRLRTRRVWNMHGEVQRERALSTEEKCRARSWRTSRSKKI